MEDIHQGKQELNAPLVLAYVVHTEAAIGLVYPLSSELEPHTVASDETCILKSTTRQQSQLPQE